MNTSPTLQDVLPASQKEVVAKAFNDEFRANLKLPRGMNKYLVSYAIDRVLLQGYTVENLPGLVKSERQYVAAVIAEFRAWEAANQANTPKES